MNLFSSFKRKSGGAPESADGPRAAFEDRFFTNADGLRLHYRDYAPAQGGGALAPVLCLHGLTRNVRDFEDIAPQIAAAGRRVIVVEQRGRGQSDYDPQPERYVPPVYAADMIGLLDELGFERVVILGTSLGGLMGMLISAQNPHRIAGLILNDIGPEIETEGLDRIRAYVGPQVSAPADWAEAGARMRALHQIAYPTQTGDAFWETFARRVYVDAPETGLRLDYDPALAGPVKEGDSANPDLWPLMDAFASIPTLVLRGAVSDILSKATVARMKELKSDLRAVDVPDVGHAPDLSEPAARAAIEDFLQSVE